MKPLVVLDIDGCFANWQGGIKRLACERARQTPDSEDLRNIERMPDAPDECATWLIAGLGLEGPEVNWFAGLIRESHKVRGFWREQVPPLDCMSMNRLTVLSLLSSIHHHAEVLFLTTRFSLVENVAVASSQWFEAHGFYHTAQVVTVQDAVMKREVLRALKPTFLMEDHPHVLQVKLPILKIFAPKYPYNAGIPGIHYGLTALLTLESLNKHLIDLRG